jgi:hypothetical protein
MSENSSSQWKITSFKGNKNLLPGAIIWWASLKSLWEAHKVPSEATTNRLSNLPKIHQINQLAKMLLSIIIAIPPQILLASQKEVWFNHSQRLTFLEPMLSLVQKYLRHRTPILTPAASQVMLRKIRRVRIARRRQNPRKRNLLKVRLTFWETWWKSLKFLKKWTKIKKKRAFSRPNELSLKKKKPKWWTRPNREPTRYEAGRWAKGWAPWWASSCLKLSNSSSNPKTRAMLTSS